MGGAAGVGGRGRQLAAEKYREHADAQGNADKMEGSTLYFMRVNEEGEFTEAGQPYCTVCSRLALQSGIKTFGLWNNGPDMIPADRYNLRSYDFFAIK